MSRRLYSLTLSLMLAGLIAPAQGEPSNADRAADDARRNVGGLDRAVPGQNENRAYDDPEITPNVNPRNAENDRGRLHPEQDNNADSKPGTGADVDPRSYEQPRNMNTDEDMYGDRMGRHTDLKVGKVEHFDYNRPSATRSGAASSTTRNRTNSSNSATMSNESGYGGDRGPGSEYGSSNGQENSDRSTVRTERRRESWSSNQTSGYQTGDAEITSNSRPDSDRSSAMSRGPEGEGAARSFGATLDPDFQVVESYTGTDTPGYGFDQNRDGRRNTERGSAMSSDSKSESSERSYARNRSRQGDNASVANDDSDTRNNRSSSSSSSTDRSRERRTDRSENTSATNSDRNSTSDRNVDKDRGEQSRDANQNGNMDKTFARKASEGNSMEVAMGKLGLERAQNARVKEFAQRMINDHGQANQKLMSVVQTKDWGIQLNEDQALQKTKAMIDKMGSENFDRMFMQHMLRDHEKDVREYQRAVDNLKDAELKTYAQQTLPIIQEHERQAREILNQVGGSNASDNNKDSMDHQKDSMNHSDRDQSTSGKTESNGTNRTAGSSTGSDANQTGTNQNGNDAGNSPAGGARSSGTGGSNQ